MPGRRLTGVGAATVALALLLAAGAQAVPAPPPKDDEGEPVVPIPFRLVGDNGWQFWGVGYSDDGVGEIAFVAHNHRSTVAYQAPATVTDTTLDADLGRLGRISLRLVPTGGTRLVRLGCEGERRSRVQTARYEGTIEFHGEEGFAELSATRAWTWHRLASLIICADEGPPESAASGLAGAGLEVDRHGDGGEFELSANKGHPGARASLSVEVEEKRGEVTIQRATAVRVGADAFRFDARLRWATLAPPAPFSGRATFRRGAIPANRWSGNLRVDLPGRANVPLTGSDLRISLVRPRS